VNRALILLNREVARVVWFAVSVGLLVVYIRWSITAFPSRRMTVGVLAWVTILLMAKFYARELVLGQSNILLGTLLVGSLLATADR
jgi:Glycosyltransferase family 87